MSFSVVLFNSCEQQPNLQTCGSHLTSDPMSRWDDDETDSVVRYPLADSVSIDPNGIAFCLMATTGNIWMMKNGLVAIQIAIKA